jgi:EmrB/QacA subfamily drug resistance transporter
MTSITARRRTQPTVVQARSWALALLCAVQLMLVLDFSIVNVALPAIGHELSLSRSGLQWVASAYGLTLGGLLLLGGRLADLLGRRRLFVTGLATFGAASLVGGLAVSGLMLIVMRAAQGAGAAMVAPALLSLITTTFPEGPQRDRALGWFGAASASGFALGVFLGGVLTQFISWRAVLFVNVPLAAAAIPLAVHLFSDTPSRAARRGYDLPGGLTVTAGLVALIYGLIQISQSGLAAAATLIPLTAGIVLLAGFGWLEDRAEAPLMPLRIFRLRALSAANGITVLVSMIMGAAVLLLSLQLQDVNGFSPLTTGLAFLPLGALVGAAATVSPRLAERFGLRPVLITAAALMTLGTLLLARVTAASSYASVVLPGMVILALGFGTFISTAAIAATDSVKDEEQGLAAGLLNSAQQLGGSLGIALLVTLANEHAKTLAGPHKVVLARSFAYGFLAAAIVGLIATVVASLALPRSVASRKTSQNATLTRSADAEPK